MYIYKKHGYRTVTLSAGYFYGDLKEPRKYKLSRKVVKNEVTPHIYNGLM